ncbi:hypothetical protein IL306_011662 [Fusarium sp. DS 682]|nr:hypothetical protein IL306_011662 [Fusarium sp. DS 682]
MERVKSWTEANPEWRWEVLTHATALGYVESHFGPHALNRPDIVEFFKKIESRIIKADLLRYLVMYVEGGLYADIDVEALKPIREFIPDGFDEGDIDVVIGVETDEPDFKDHPILGGLSRSFVQWTFLCKPKLPIMMRIVESLMTNIQQLVKEQGVPLFEVKLDFYQIIGNSGPGLFTSLIMQHMQEISNQKEPITWDTFHHLDQPKLASRVLVLPVKAFAACQTHSRSGKTYKIPEALIKHHYGASNWTDWHPRYKHPVYGFVEDCLFNTTCVRQWEKNVKVYKGHKFS